MDTSEFKRASHGIWEAMAPGWDRHHGYFEEIGRPVTERMLERLAPAPGETLLELAAGTGVVGFAAAEAVAPEGRVIISDFAEGMVEAAQRQAQAHGVENVDFRVLDAEELDLPDDSVDGVLCRWGLMLLADPAAALAQTRRVLRPEGRVSCAVFGSPETNPWVAIPSRVLMERGHMPPPSAGMPGILALADEDRIRSLLAGADFGEPRIDEVPAMMRFDDADHYWEFLTAVAGAIALVLGRLDAEERAHVREEVLARVAEHAGPDGLELASMSLVISAS